MPDNTRMWGSGQSRAVCVCVWIGARFAQNSGHSLTTCISIHPYRPCVELNSTRSNVESRSTALPLFQFERRVTLDSASRFCCTMSSHIRQRVPLYQVQYLAHIDVLFYILLFWFFLSSCHIMAALELWILELLCKINLNYTTGVHKNNLDRTRVKIYRRNLPYKFSYLALQHIWF